MNYTKVIQSVIDTLIHIIESDRKPRVGLCGAVVGLLRDEIAIDFWVNTREEHFRSWDKFSGSTEYPVPSGDDYSPKVAYNCTRNLYVGTYGELRLDLAKHIIRKLEELKEIL